MRAIARQLPMSLYLLEEESLYFVHGLISCGIETKAEAKEEGLAGSRVV